MKHSDKTSLAMLISTAKSDARKSVSKWRWSVLGLCLSFLPKINIPALCIAILVVYILIPKIDLYISARVEIYSLHPALYTLHYRKAAKTVRLLSIFCGWIIGVISLVSFL